ncbi:MAG: peptidase, partial [Frankiales bacterium]|nr:peptidase [Frankiales bacterium]
MNRIVRRLLAAVLAGMALFASAAFGLIATGRAGFVVTHGVSMNPVYYQGDLVVIAKAPSYRIGEIVAYHRAGHSDVVLHRIIGGGPAGYVFKGDNNQSIDPTRPTQEQLAGRAVYHLARGGLWLHRFTSPTALGLLAFTLLAGGATAVRTRPRGRRARLSKHASTSSKPLALSALPPALRACAAAAAAVGAVGLALGALAWGGPLDTESTVSTHSANRMTFSYTAAVGRTPAYDGTTASSPDPVFRKLANDVDVHFTYTGAP